jgi:thymidylate kinase
MFECAIFEGVDGVGKSTLIERFCEYLREETGRDPVVVHPQKPPAGLSGEAVLQYQEAFFNGLMKEAVFPMLRYFPVVMNRSYPGEYVYSQLYRQASRERLLYLRKLEEELPFKPFFFLLETGQFDLRDDGQNMNYLNLKREQELFKIFFEHSILQRKKAIAVKPDGWRDPDDILWEAICYFESQLL